MDIKEMRFLCGMTQLAFAVRLQIPKRTIENWESGQRSCPKYLRSLIEYYLINEGLLSTQEDDDMENLENDMEQDEINQKMQCLELSISLKHLQNILVGNHDKYKPLSEYSKENKSGMYYDDNNPRQLPRAFYDTNVGYPALHDPEDYTDEDGAMQIIYDEDDPTCFPELEGLHIDFVPKDEVYRIYSPALMDEANKNLTRDDNVDFCTDVIVVGKHFIQIEKLMD